MIEFEDPKVVPARIKVVGVGGGGGNALTTMISSGLLSGVEFIVANTDMQALNTHTAPIKLQLGPQLNRGLGAGANPEKGREAANESLDQITQALYGADMIFITAGMGGGTGTGAAPIIARAAKETGALTVAVVTKPFMFEGVKRMQQAEEGIFLLREEVDALIVIPNEKLMGITGNRTPLTEAFPKVDQVLLNAVSGITEVIYKEGLINVDFADVRTIMADTGPALMGTGIATGPNRAIEATDQAVSSPLLDDVSINGATGILINFTGSSDLSLWEVENAVKKVEACTGQNAQIIFGAVVDESMNENVKVTVIATGLCTDTAATQHPPYHVPTTANPSHKRVPIMRDTIDLHSGYPSRRPPMFRMPHQDNFMPAGAPAASGPRGHQQPAYQPYAANQGPHIQTYDMGSLTESGAHRIPVAGQPQRYPGPHNPWHRQTADPIYGNPDGYRRRNTENMGNSNGSHQPAVEQAQGAVNQEPRWGQTGGRSGTGFGRSFDDSLFAMEPVSQQAAAMVEKARRRAEAEEGNTAQDEFNLQDDHVLVDMGVEKVDRVRRVHSRPAFKLKK